jgi:hypothetical protein
VELVRLLALVRLTPVQAAEIGAEVLAAVLRQPVPDGGADEDRVAGRVLVTGEGRVLLAPAGAAAARPVGVVLADVLAAARVPGPATDTDADRVLAALDRAVAELPATGVPGAAKAVQAASAGADHPAVRAELGALVSAVGAVIGAGVPGAGSGAVVRTAAPHSAPRGGPAAGTPARTGPAGRRIGAWLLSFLVLAGIVGAEVVVLRDDIAADIDLLLDSGRGEQGAPDPEPELPVPTPAPAAAGAVTGVDLRPLAVCSPGTPCPVRLLVRVAPGAEPQVVTWTFSLVDRCTGAVSSAPGGTVTVPSSADRAAAIGVVALPAVPAVAVTAVTGAPAVAASPPVLAGSCPTGGG